MAYQACDKQFRQSAQITLFNIPVEVVFYHYPPIDGSEDEEPVPEDLEIEEVIVDEFNILGLIGEEAMAKLYEEVYKVIDRRKNEVE